jgi:hypothetical protein
VFVETRGGTQWGNKLIQEAAQEAKHPVFGSNVVMRFILPMGWYSDKTGSHKKYQHHYHCRSRRFYLYQMKILMGLQERSRSS